MAACVDAGVLSACGGGAGSGVAGPTPPSLISATPAEDSALTASTPGMLLTYFKQKIKAQPAVSSSDSVLRPTTLSPAAALAAPVVAVNETQTAFAGTTLQESGVDESDWIKTDGKILYGLTTSYYANSGTFSGTKTLPQLQAQRRLADGQLAPLARVTLTHELNYTGMYLVSGASRLALVGEKSVNIGVQIDTQPPPALTNGASQVSLAPASLLVAPNVTQSKIGIDVLSTPEINTSSAANLSVTHSIRLDGRLLGTRVIGNTLYLVSTWQPYLGKYSAGATATAAQAAAVIDGLSTAEILPTIQINNSAAAPLLADSDCYVQAANASASLELTTITAFDLASKTLQHSSRCFLGGNQAMYMSASAVYVASSRYISGQVSSTTNNAASLPLPSNAKTDIHKFALLGQTVSYRGSGEVAGHLGWEADKNAYRMSEFEGNLRVLTFTGQQGWGAFFNVATAASQAATLPAPSPATLTVLRETAGKLQTVGTLPNVNRPAPIGKPGEQIYAVKFVGPRAYVVTFRRTDPLYVLDVSDPADPKTIGELEIPGYSDYLFPVGDGLLLGVGKDANDSGLVQGIKVALIDVADPAKPLVRNSVVLGGRGSESALDSSSRGISIFQQGDVFRVALPVRLNETPARFESSVFSPTRQGLARFEVDALAKTLSTKPLLVGVSYSAKDNENSLSYLQYNVAQDRSTHIGSFVYYFTGGAFLPQAW